jgi:hypothetical protein
MQYFGGAMDRVYVRRSGLWIRTFACFVYKQGAWRVMYYFDPTPGPAATELHKGEVTHTSATMSWDLTPGGIFGHQIVCTYGTIRGGKFYALDPKPRIAEIPIGVNTYTWPALEADRAYKFQLKTRNEFYVLSNPSKGFIMTTGHPVAYDTNPRGDTPDQIRFNGKFSDSWSKERGWNKNNFEDQFPRSVMQGHNTKNELDYFFWGVVDYSNVPAQFRNHIRDVPENDKAKYLEDVASTIKIHDADFVQILRYEGGANAAVELNCSMGDANFDENKQPTRVSHAATPSFPEKYERFTFDSPLENKYLLQSTGGCVKKAGAIETLRYYADRWLQPHCANPCLVVHYHVEKDSGSKAAGWGHYCRLRGVGGDREDWDLLLTMTWKHKWRDDEPAEWWG